MAHPSKDVEASTDVQPCRFPSTGTFKCRCDGSFSTLLKLKGHLRHVHLGKHTDKMLHCKCGDQFSSIAGLVQHRKHPPRKIELLRTCSKCNTEPYRKLTDLLDHFSRCHSEDSDFLQEVFKCEEEGCEHAVGATTMTQFKEHDKRYHSDPNERPCKCEHCPMAYKEMSDLRSHMEKKHGDGVQQTDSKYTCPVLSCAKGFGNINAFEKHVNGTHPGQKMSHLLCPICGLQFTVSSTFGKHLKTKHQTSIRKLKIKQCPLCNHEGEDLMAHFISQHGSLRKHLNTCIRCGFESKDKIHKHVYAVHGRDQEVLKWYFTCGIDKCTTFTETAKQLEEHKRRQHGNDLSHNKRCSICAQRFTITTALMSHYLTAHPSDTDAIKIMLTCKICKKELGSLKQLYLHRRSHYKDKVTCGGCSATISRYYLHTHVEIMHAKQPDILKMYFGCRKSWCHEHFKTYRQLKQHMVAHSFGKKPGKFVCTTCNRPFLTERTRLVHEAVHHRLPELLFKCPHSGCSEISPNVTSYKRHMSTTHEKEEDPRPSRCPVCLKVTKDPRVLMSHMIQTHFSPTRKKVSALMCQFPGCQKICTDNKEKKNHMKMDHSTILEIERACHVCNTMIGSREMVMLHIMEDHKEDDAFVKGMLTCNIDNCQETLQNLDQLRRHRQTHGPSYEKKISQIKPTKKYQPMKCDINGCPVTVRGMRAWLFHRAEHDGLVQFHQCKQCPKVFQRKFSLTRHVKQCTGKLNKRDIGTRKCDRAGCKVIRYTDADMTLHYMDHVQSGDSFQCWICGTMLPSLLQLGGHLRLDQCDVKNIRSKDTTTHVFEVVGAYVSDTKDLAREWRFTCNLCPTKYQTRRELLVHVDKTHHYRYKIKGPLQTGLDQSQNTKKCTKCDLVLPCPFALMIHSKVFHPKKACLRNPHIVRRWCSCCNFESPPRALIPPQVFATTKTEETEALPVVMKCLACDYSTKNWDDAFLHIRENLEQNYWINLEQPTGTALLTANNYDKCRECKLIFHNEYEYLSHLQSNHYDNYIEELVHRYPYMEDSAIVIHYRKHRQNYENLSKLKHCRVRLSKCDSTVTGIPGPSTTPEDTVKETGSSSKALNPKRTVRRNPERKCTIKAPTTKRFKEADPTDDESDGSCKDSDPEYAEDSLGWDSGTGRGRKQPVAKLQHPKRATRRK